MLIGAIAMSLVNDIGRGEAIRPREYYPPKPHIDPKDIGIVDTRKIEQEEWNRQVEQAKIDKKAKRHAKDKHNGY